MTVAMLYLYHMTLLQGGGILAMDDLTDIGITDQDDQ